MASKKLSHVLLFPQSVSRIPKIPLPVPAKQSKWQSLKSLMLEEQILAVRADQLRHALQKKREQIKRRMKHRRRRNNAGLFVVAKAVRP